MQHGCSRPIYRNSKWHYCGEDSLFCADCGGDMQAMTDDEVAEAIIRAELSGNVHRDDRTTTVVICVLLVVALIAWLYFGGSNAR